MTTSGEALHTFTDQTRDFALWALEAMQFRVEAGGNSYTVFPPADRPEVFQGAGHVRFHFGTEESLSESPGLEYLGPGSRMFNWLVDELTKNGKLIHAAPEGQPENVHDLSNSLFDAYTIEGGNVHLAGCSLEDRPFLRLTYAEISGTSIFHCFVDEGGAFVSREEVSSLSLNRAKPQMERPADSKTEEELLALVEKADESVVAEIGRRDAELGELDPDSRPRLLVTTVVWCKYATGKLAFEVGDQSTELEFAGWTSHFVQGAQSPPPYVCPRTGAESYHLVLADGAITVAEALSECEETGQRVPASELKTCAVSNKAVVATQLERCPVTDEDVLSSLLESCSLCGQRVSPKCIRNLRCESCRSLKNVDKGDARLTGTFEKFPRLLSEWRRWSIAESNAMLVIHATTMTKQMIVVLEKESLGVQRIATAGRLFAKWNEVPESEQAALLS